MAGGSRGDGPKPLPCVPACLRRPSANSRAQRRMGARCVSVTTLPPALLPELTFVPLTGLVSQEAAFWLQTATKVSASAISGAAGLVSQLGSMEVRMGQTSFEEMTHFGLGGRRWKNGEEPVGGPPRARRENRGDRLSAVPAALSGRRCQGAVLTRPSSLRPLSAAFPSPPAAAGT